MLRIRLYLLFVFLLPSFQSLSAQNVVADASASSGPVIPTVEDKHAFGVLPNYRTTESSRPFERITVKQKFTIATQDTFSPPSYLLGGVFAGLSQLNNSNPSFGQGMEGYAKRYATNTADQDIGNFMTEAVMPSLLHEDPRYFRRATGSKKSRILYALTRVAVTRTDAGTSRFNFSEFLGNGSVAAIGNLYYPDDKGLSPTAQRMFTQIGTDAISNVLKEFWPDVKRKLGKHSAVSAD